MLRRRTGRAPPSTAPAWCEQMIGKAERWRRRTQSKSGPSSLRRRRRPRRSARASRPVAGLHRRRCRGGSSRRRNRRRARPRRRYRRMSSASALAGSSPPRGGASRSAIGPSSSGAALSSSGLRSISSAMKVFDLEVRQREQADRLLQLRRHHQRLRLPKVEARREGHGWLQTPLPELVEGPTSLRTRKPSTGSAERRGAGRAR